MATIYFVPTQDAYISEFYPNQNFGTSPALFAGQFTGPCDDYRSLIQFNLCSRICNYIPPGSCIESACLRLYVYRNHITCECVNIKVYQLLQDFDQTTVTWNTQPLAYGIASGNVHLNPGVIGFIDIPITDLVRGWYEGSIEQHGLLIKGAEKVNALVGFRSIKFFDSTFWPRLIVHYS